ncbi:MAG: peptidoglycan editing factor PgeF [Anaerolineae bacterium]|nr:MAG: peptidoglycan editing factor PgeF [Anaerolineae bacterium]
MPLHTDTDIPHFTFALLDAAGVQHAVFTRQGGVSPPPWNSLNMGGTVGDQRERVLANIRRGLQFFGRDLRSVYDVWQVHGRDVICASAPRNGAEYARADAILSDTPGLTLMMRFADCVPVLLYDPVHRVAGMVHAGWQGTVKGVVLAAVERMQVQYGSRPQDILAGIGPSIGPDHYEVGPEVVVQVQEAFGAQADTLLFTPNGRTHLDLWRANALWLHQAGVQQVEIAGLCTACDLEHWYSHRAEGGATGRFGAMIVVP